MFVQLHQPAVTTGSVGSREQASCNKTRMCLFDGLLEIRVQLGGERMCQRCEWIIQPSMLCRVGTIFKVRSIYQLNVFVPLGEKAKRVTGRERACETADEVFPWHWARAKNKRRNHKLSFSHRFSLHVSLWQVEPQCASFTVCTVQSEYITTILFGLQCTGSGMKQWLWEF